MTIIDYMICPYVDSGCYEDKCMAFVAYTKEQEESARASGQILKKGECKLILNNIPPTFGIRH